LPVGIEGESKPLHAKTLDIARCRVNEKNGKFHGIFEDFCGRVPPKPLFYRVWGLSLPKKPGKITGLLVGIEYQLVYILI
jgi:hypothetical protein